MSQPFDRFGSQAKVAAQRIEACPQFWNYLCRDVIAREVVSPSAVETPISLLHWFEGKSQNSIRALMFAIRRALQETRPGASDDIQRQAESAAVALYLFAAFHWVAVQVPSGSKVAWFNHTDVPTPSLLRLYCSIICGALSGARVELVPSEVRSPIHDGRYPTGADAHHLQLPAGCDQPVDAFERELYVSIYPEDPNAIGLAQGDGKLTKIQRARLNQKIETLWQVDERKLTVVLIEPSVEFADEIALSEAMSLIDAPLFAATKKKSGVSLSEVSVEKLVADLESFWNDVRLYAESITAHSVAPAPRQSKGHFPIYGPRDVSQSPEPMMPTQNITINTGPVIHGNASGVSWATANGGDATSSISGGVHSNNVNNPLANFEAQLKEIRDVIATLGERHAVETLKISEYLDRITKLADDLKVNPADPAKKDLIKRMAERIKVISDGVEGFGKLAALADRAITFLN